MDNEDKRKMATSLDERINEVWRMTHNQFDMINYLLSVNHDISRKVKEIANLRSDNNQLKA